MGESECESGESLQEKQGRKQLREVAKDWEELVHTGVPGLEPRGVGGSVFSYRRGDSKDFRRKGSWDCQTFARVTVPRRQKTRHRTE